MVPPHPGPLPRGGEGIKPPLGLVAVLIEFFVEHGGDEDCRQGKEGVAEREAQEVCGPLREVERDRDVIFGDDLRGLRGAERDHGVAAAFGADADLYAASGERVEDGGDEADRRGEPDGAFEDSREGQDECGRPERGFGFGLAVCGGVFEAYVVAACAEFLH